MEETPFERFRRDFRKSEVIFEEGSQGNEMCIVKSGKVRLFTKDETGQEVTVAVVERGGFFGEMALIDYSPRSATALAEKDTALIGLDRAKFLYLIQQQPGFVFTIMHTPLQTGPKGQHAVGQSCRQGGQRMTVELRPGIFQLPAVKAGSHVYLLRGTSKNLLIDTGTAASLPRLEASLSELGLRVSDIQFVVLTHEHFDHIGTTCFFFQTAVIAAHRLAANKIEFRTSS